MIRWSTSIRVIVLSDPRLAPNTRASSSSNAGLVCKETTPPLARSITRRGAPVTLKAEPFGPGFARLGIVRYYVTAGPEPGVAQIEAQLQGGTRYTINVIVER